MKLSGPQREQICGAILAGYDEPNLQRLVEFSLEQRLDHIAGGDNLTDQVAGLVRWAERKGYLAELVQAAYERNPKNPALQQLWDDFGEWNRSAAPGTVHGAGRAARSAKDNGRWRSIALVALAGLLLVGGLWGAGQLMRDDESATPHVVTPKVAESAESATTPQAETAAQPTDRAALTPEEAPATPAESTELDAELDAGNAITVGQTVTGELFGAETNNWLLSGINLSIDILLDSGPRSEALILIFDADGNILYDLDVQNGPEERLVKYQLFDEGPYTIAVRNLQNQPADYSLTVTESLPPQQISLGETVSGKFYGAEGINWIFSDGPATISLTLDVGPRGDAAIIISDEKGRQIEYTNPQSSAEARLVNYEIPDDQPYTITIRNEANQPTDYTLHLE